METIAMERSSPRSPWHAVTEFEGPRKKALRTSCDLCQSLKIKCSQDKPSCYRCVKHDLNCVYSPLKRMGRPRKGVTNPTPSSQTQQRRDTRDDTGEPALPRQQASTNSDSSHSDGMLLSSTNDVDALEHWSRPINGLSDHVPGSARVPDSDLAAQSDIADSTAIQMDTSTKPSSGTIPTTESSTSHGSLGSGDNFVNLYPDTIMGDFPGSADPSATLSNGFGSSEQRGSQATSTNGFWRLAGPPFHPQMGNSQTDRLWPIDGPVPPDPNVNNGRRPDSSRLFMAPNSTATQTGVSPDKSYDTGRQSISAASLNDGEADINSSCKGQCYISILQRLLQLEQSLAFNTGHLPLDFVLTAERDAKALKERLFECPSRARKNMSDDPVGNTGGDWSCLDSRYSSLLILAVLVDRVVGLLEDLFRRAAVNAHGLDRAFRTAWYMSPPTSSNQEADVDAGAPWQPGASKRLERSIRSAFDRNINCPVPEANCELTIGNYELDNEAKSRAMKRILRLRIGALERMVGDVETYLVGKGMATSSRGGDIDSGLGNLLGAVRSSEMQLATTKMVKDLHRRIELLQGRLELAE